MAVVVTNKKIPSIREALLENRLSITDPGRFRYWHVEPLLNQAADLLDRCLAGQSAYNQLRAEWYKSRQSLIEADRLQMFAEERKNLGSLSQEADVIASQTGHRTSADTNFAAAGNSAPDPFSQHQAWASQKINNAEIAALNTRKAWLDSTENLRGREHAIQNNFLQERDWLLYEEERATNYIEQCDTIVSLIRPDLYDALGRLGIAAKGLVKIYGYDKEVELATVLSEKNPIEYAVNWVRAAIRWLASFSQLDQAFSRIISVRQQIGDGVWNSTVSAADRSMLFSFSLPNNLFNQHLYVRMRGLSVALLSDKEEERSWRAIVHLPKWALARFWNPTSGSIDQQPGFDQSELPPCDNGRVQMRSSLRPPELAGMISLMNASPIGVPDARGRYQVEVHAPDRGPPLFNELVDIELELNMTGRPVTGLR